MLQTPLDSSYKLRFNIRPIKIAYFIPDDDDTSLTRILRLVCTQWGGIRNLIIPVKSDITIAPLYQRLLQLHEPDWFVGYLMNKEGKGQEAHNQLLSLIRNLFPGRSITIQVGDFFEKHDESMHTLSIINGKDAQSKLLTIYRPNSRALSEQLHLALYGAIYKDQKDDYRKLLRIHEESISSGAPFWESQFLLDPFASAINLTSYGVHPYQAHDSSESNHFDICIVDSLYSLCMYWNLRALREAVQFEKGMGRRTLLFPISLLKDHQRVTELISFLRGSLAYPNIYTNTPIRFCVWDKETREKVISVISDVDEFRPLKNESIQVTHKYSSVRAPRIQSFKNKKLTYVFGGPNIPASYQETVGRYLSPTSVVLRQGGNEIRFEPPSEYHNRLGGNVALDIESNIWTRYPRSYQVVQAIKGGSWFSRYGLSMVVDLPSRPHDITFTLPEEIQSLRLFFESKGYNITPSKVSQYSDAVVKLVGGVEGLHVFASPYVYQLLNLLAVKSTLKVGQRIAKAVTLTEEQMSDIRTILDDFEIMPELQGIPKTLTELKSDQRFQAVKKQLLTLLDSLCRYQVLMRGFYLYCPNCGTPDWYPLHNLREQLTCPGCSYEFLLPVKEKENAETDIQWRYRLNSLVNRAMDQDVFTGLLSLYTLTKNRKSSCKTFGLEIHQNGQRLTDFDFLFVSDQQLYAGECKAGTELAEKDLAIASLAAAVGVNTFYYSTLQEFSVQTQAKIEQLKQKLLQEGCAIKVEVLSGKDLLGNTVET